MDMVIHFTPVVLATGNSVGKRGKTGILVYC